jgi:ATP adenylyltransferase
MDNAHHSDLEDGGARRLWTPWRMQYVGGSTAETGCIFCNRISLDDDLASLILYRATHCFAIMNLFPYNTGHIMLVPNEHVASPEVAPAEAMREMATLLPGILKALRRVLACHGFNVGLNIGSVAGAGVAIHMHQHIVPRWNGDANFMPILANTTVMPELIPVTYAKLRAELARELGSLPPNPVAWIMLDQSGEHVLLEPDGSFPVLDLEPDISIWRTAIQTAAGRGFAAYVLGWAGESLARPSETITIALQTQTPVEGTIEMAKIETARSNLAAHDRRTLERTLSIPTRM